MLRKMQPVLMQSTVQRSDLIRFEYYRESYERTKWFEAILFIRLFSFFYEALDLLRDTFVNLGSLDHVRFYVHPLQRTPTIMNPSSDLPLPSGQGTVHCFILFLLFSHLSYVLYVSLMHNIHSNVIAAYYPFYPGQISNPYKSGVAVDLRVYTIYYEWTQEINAIS
jgi:hypothetical protein